jgi:aryl-alcohol dehydrogenase-like predicted oxidoreductase
MQYALLGNTGLAVSRLAFGAMTFTQGNKNLAAVYKVGAKLADELVGQALDAGVNLFDTADGYAGGESETLLGAALKQRRDQVVIATKVGFRSGPPTTQSGLSRRHILWSVDQSLRRLGTEWIDIYIVHREDPFTPIEETVEALDTVVRAGKVRYLGFSNWSAWKVAAALEMQRARGLAPFTHGQMYYSLLGRDVERDVIPMMRRYGLGLTVWSRSLPASSAANIRARPFPIPTIAIRASTCCRSTRSSVSSLSSVCARLPMRTARASRKSRSPGCFHVRLSPVCS